MAQSGQIQIAPHMQWIGEDLVRVRCRALRHFLEETDCTHLLFWDADVGGSDPTGERACCALALMGMIAEDVDVIGVDTRASESWGTKFGRSTSTTLIPGRCVDWLQTHRSNSSAARRVSLACPSGSR